MTTIQFYHLTATPLERALPALLNKALSASYRVLLVEKDEARRKFLGEYLWTYDPGSFLPHGSTDEPHVELQPVLLSETQENRNGANLLMCVDGSLAESATDFERVIDMIDGHNPEAVASARARWKSYKDAGHSVTYFKQTEAGGWQASG